jgi:hypothetical protein
VSERKLVLIGGLLLTLVAAALRLWALPDFAFRGDEYGTLECVQWPVCEILSTYSGQLTMHSYILAMKVWSALFGSSPLAFKIPSLLAGIALVALLFSLSRSWMGVQQAWVAAALAAFSILLIRYSQVARVYSLLALLTVVSWALYERVWRGGGWAATAAWTLVNIIALTSSLNSVYLLAAQGVHALLCAVAGIRPSRRRILQLWGALGAALGLSVLFYSASLADILEFREMWAGGALRSDWIPWTFLRFHESLAYPVLGLMVLGVIRLWSQRRELAVLLLLWAFLPWLFYWLLGSRHPQTAFVRFLIPTLPAHLMLVAAGSVGLLQWLLPGSWARASGSLASAALLAGLIVPLDYASKVGAGKGRPYQAAFEFIRERAAPSDLLSTGVIGTDRPELEEGFHGLPPLLPPDALSTQKRPPQAGRLFLLSRRIEGAGPLWERHFKFQAFLDPRGRKEVVVLVGPEESAGGAPLYLALRQYYQSCTEAAAQGHRLDRVPARHFMKLWKVYRQLQQLAILEGRSEAARRASAEMDRCQVEYQKRSANRR